MPRCPECGGKMIYRRDAKMYTCTNCGLMLTREELDERRKKAAENLREEKRSKAVEYLEWWLGESEE